MDDKPANHLWELAYSCLEHHRKSNDGTANDALNRLVREYVPAARDVRLGEENCSIREESWTNDQLAQVARRHSRANPKHEAGPLLVVVYNGVGYLVDGNNRVNKWIAQQDIGFHPVLIIEYGQP